MFYFNRGSLEVGPEWQDKSIILLTNDSQSISVTYDKLPFGMTFLEFCEREISSIGKQLTRYQELLREPIKIGECEGILTEFTWDSPKGKFHQLTAIIDLQDGFPVILTTTNVGLMSPNQKEALLAILHTFKPQIF